MSINKSRNQIELYPLGNDKDLIFKALSQNKDFVDLVLGENPTTKLRKHFYNTLIIDTTQLEAKTYITIDTNVVSAQNTKIKCIEIIIDFFTALSLTELSDDEMIRYYNLGFAGNRIDVGVDMIKRTITNLDVGIGKTTLAPRYSVKIIQPTNNFYGKRLTFHSYDF